MRIKSISLAAARDAWKAQNDGAQFDINSIDVEEIGNDDSVISDLDLVSLVTRLKEIQENGSSKVVKSHGGVIDSRATEIVHSELSQIADVYQLSHIGFWRWLSNVAHNGFFWKFVMWRFNGGEPINWGIANHSQIIEVYLYRAWLRGHKMYDESESDPYKYAKLGSSDVWRSHILRQDFGRDREFVKAFLDSIYDEKGKTVIKTKELREHVIPALRAWISGSTFTHLSYTESLELIRKLRKDGI